MGRGEVWGEKREGELIKHRREKQIAVSKRLTMNEANTKIHVDWRVYRRVSFQFRILLLNISIICDRELKLHANRILFYQRR